MVMMDVRFVAVFVEVGFAPLKEGGAFFARACRVRFQFRRLPAFHEASLLLLVHGVSEAN